MYEYGTGTMGCRGTKHSIIFFWPKYEKICIAPLKRHIKDTTGKISMCPKM